MIYSDLFNQYQQMKNNRLQVFFKGAISQDVLAELGSMIRSSLHKENNVKKIFAVFIEMAQNILHYSAEMETNEHGKKHGVGIIVINEQNNDFFIYSGNIVLNSNANKIKDKCDYINSLPKNELKNYYHTQLKMPRPEDSKGAGVGLIDIARKCDGQIQCQIDKVDETYSFLTLSVFFKKES